MVLVALVVLTVLAIFPENILGEDEGTDKDVWVDRYIPRQVSRLDARD